MTSGLLVPVILVFVGGKVIVCVCVSPSLGFAAVRSSIVLCFCGCSQLLWVGVFLLVLCIGLVCG